MICAPTRRLSARLMLIAARPEGSAASLPLGMRTPLVESMWRSHKYFARIAVRIKATTPSETSCSCPIDTSASFLGVCAG